jgi:nucleoid-associated protein YgaU
MKNISVVLLLLALIGSSQLYSVSARSDETEQKYDFSDYTVQKGDTFTSIIIMQYRALGLKVHMYGKGGMLEKMTALNSDVIPDAHKIFPGTKVKFPELMRTELAQGIKGGKHPARVANNQPPTNSEYAPPVRANNDGQVQDQGQVYEDGQYVIQKGDTLTSVIILKYRAQGLKVHMYGEDGMLAKMLKVNSDVVTNPRKILPGTKIKFPQEMVVIFQEVDELTNNGRAPASAKHEHSER